jgi:Helix-turn-helix domain
LSNNGSMETEYLTVEQVAKMLNVHPDTVRSRFCKEPGVIDLSADRKVRRGRRHRILRIPRGVVSRYLHEHRVR